MQKSLCKELCALDKKNEDKKLWTGQKQISGLARHLIFHRFSPVNGCLSVVL